MAIAEPSLPVLSVIVEAWTLCVPRFESPPPRPPDVLPATVELVSVTVPLGWTLIPPPLIGASLLMIAERSTVVAPLLMIAPPPTLVVVLCENVESSTVSVAPASFAIAPPLPAELLENVEFLTVSVPLF